MSGEEGPANHFFTASPLKLVLLSVFTFGYYELYWFYRNWLLYRERSGKKIRPLWRAVLAPLWAYSLFNRIYTEAESRDQTVIGTAKILAIAYIILLLLHSLPDPFDIISVLTVVPLFFANQAAAAVNRAAVPDYRENSRFGALNILALFFGILFVVLSVVFDYLDVPALDEFHKNSGFSISEKMNQRLGR